MKTFNLLGAPTPIAGFVHWSIFLFLYLGLSGLLGLAFLLLHPLQIRFNSLTCWLRSTVFGIKVRTPPPTIRGPCWGNQQSVYLNHYWMVVGSTQSFFKKRYFHFYLGWDLNSPVNNRYPLVFSISINSLANYRGK